MLDHEDIWAFFERFKKAWQVYLKPGDNVSFKKNAMGNRQRPITFKRA